MIDYLDLIQKIKDKQNLFITGSAGTGKTHLIKALYYGLLADGLNVALTSTTGITALNIGGVTIHKLLGINVSTSKEYVKFLRSQL
jgi:archaellum biogenesis ATPase FlaH